MSRDKPETWTKPRAPHERLLPEEIDFIRDGFLAGRTRYDVAQDLRCSCRVVSKYYRRIRDSIRARSPQFARRERISAVPRGPNVHAISASARPSEVALARREVLLAALERRDLTAAICGDPPPGFSALDRR
jgi:hypothetical protein